MFESMLTQSANSIASAIGSTFVLLLVFIIDVFLYLELGLDFTLELIALWFEDYFDVVVCGLVLFYSNSVLIRNDSFNISDYWNIILSKLKFFSILSFSLKSETVWSSYRSNLSLLNLESDIFLNVNFLILLISFELILFTLARRFIFLSINSLFCLLPSILLFSL